MLDGWYKAAQDRFWDRVARPLVGTGVTPNQLTLAGTLLVIGSALAFVQHRQTLWLGASVAVLEMLDNLDGALARVSGNATRFGAYLDALTDRYKETALFAAIAYVRGDFALGFFCVTGSLLTSYAKARACMEGPLSNDGWPDLFERFERMAILCAGLILTTFVPQLAGHDLLHWALVVIACGTHLAALQRTLRARTLLVRSDDPSDQTK